MAKDGRRHIVPGGGQFGRRDAGGYTMGPLVEYLLDLTGKLEPRVGILNTAVGDEVSYYAAMYAGSVNEARSPQGPVSARA